MLNFFRWKIIKVFPRSAIQKKIVSFPSHVNHQINIRKYWIINSYITHSEIFTYFCIFQNRLWLLVAVFTGISSFSPPSRPVGFEFFEYIYNVHKIYVHIHTYTIYVYIYIHIQYVYIALNKITMKKPGKNLTLASILCRPKNLNKHW